nr:hypothetical protein GCM10020185_79980 [Pseudomonas brassicacearum subsp. brassicacearum]
MRPSTRAISAPTSAARLAKFFRTLLRPGLEPLLIGNYRQQVLPMLVHREAIAAGGPGQGAIEMKLGFLEERLANPE